MTSVEIKLIDYVDGFLQFRSRGQAVSPDYCLDRLIETHKKQGVFAQDLKDRLVTSEYRLDETRKDLKHHKYLLMPIFESESLPKWRRILIKWLSRGNINLGL